VTTSSRSSVFESPLVVYGGALSANGTFCLSCELTLICAVFMYNRRVCVNIVRVARVTTNCICIEPASTWPDVDVVLFVLNMFLIRF
jgi:hypothetical protein